MPIFYSLILVIMLAANIWAEDTQQHFEKFYLQGYSDSGTKAWDVRGDTAQIQGNTVHIAKVNANRYGDQKVNLTADQGQLNKDSGNIHLEKNVIITALETGGQLKTDHLDWDKSKDLVQTDAPVTITEPQHGMTASGIGLQAKPGFKVATMTEDVKVTMTPQQSKANLQSVTITCDGPMQIDQKLNKAVFNTNVVAVETDRTLKADLMEVYFDAETSQIKQAVCTGHVEIIQGGNITHSDKAVYDGAGQTLTLTGKPKLIIVTNKELMPGKKDKK